MIQRLVATLASLRVTVAGLLLLLVLTVWGTLYQVDHGLYRAQERFYQSWWLWIGDRVPFPGAQLVMAMLFVNLIASLLLLVWRRRLRWGFFITHTGLLLMLAAGAVTFYLGRESQLSLVEGESSNTAISFSRWELALLGDSPGPRRTVQALDTGALRTGRVIPLPGVEASLRIDAWHRHCEPRRLAVADPPASATGFTALAPRPPNKEPAEDMPGLIFTLVERGQVRGRHLIWGGDPGPLALEVDGRTLRLGLRRARMPLPATIQLLDFRREMHPGSGIAKSYSSQVLVRSGDSPGRRVLISMNKPLRLGGYTFYQSSFSSAPGGREVSTLSVVHNYGRLMPYIATGLTVAGMLLHFSGMLILRLRAAPRRASA